MKFEIDFSTEDNNELLKELGAVKEVNRSEKYPFEYFEIEINTFEELEVLLNKVDKINGGFYTAMITFDPPIIYLDKNV